MMYVKISQNKNFSFQAPRIKSIQPVVVSICYASAEYMSLA